MPESIPHVITGVRDEVHAALIRANEEGRLVRVIEARLLPGERVQVVAHLRVPSRVRSRWEQARLWLVVAMKVAAVLAVLAAVAGVVWLIVLAVMWVVALVTAALAWLHAHLLGIVLGGAALLFLIACCCSGGCAGMHCGGCRG